MSAPAYLPVDTLAIHADADTQELVAHLALLIAGLNNGGWPTAGRSA